MGFDWSLYSKILNRELRNNPASGLSDLPVNYGIQIEIQDSKIWISYYNLRAKRQAAKSRKDKIYGRISMQKSSQWGPCLDAWMVAWVEAAPGWGPLLYDIAIEVASQLGGGIMADRTVVSEDAHRVWNFYQSKRPDVTKAQLDNLGIPVERRLTPEIEYDDCDMTSALNWASKTGLQWHQVPESLKLSKSPEIIETLKASGRLILKPGLQYPLF